MTNLDMTKKYFKPVLNVQLLNRKVITINTDCAYIHLFVELRCQKGLFSLLLFTRCFNSSSGIVSILLCFSSLVSPMDIFCFLKRFIRLSVQRDFNQYQQMAIFYCQDVPCQIQFYTKTNNKICCPPWVYGYTYIGDRCTQKKHQRNVKR